MRQKQEKRNHEPGGGGPGASGAHAPGRDLNELRRLLANGHSKPALELAKQIHKCVGTPETESLLVEAYAARVQSLLAVGLEAEAKALLEIARERYPAAHEKLENAALMVAAQTGSVDDLLRSYIAPETSAKKRTEIENSLRRSVTDLASVAQSQVLDKTHPLRAGAAALQEAFQAVTNGPIANGAVNLDGISHRGPLAPWKMLVLALRSFYAQDDDACERFLLAVDPDSVPARAIPVLRALIARDAGGPLRPAAQTLAEQVGGGAQALRRALQCLDSAFDSKREDRILLGVREAVKRCREHCPDLLDSLRQHLSIRGVMRELRVEPLRKAMEGPARKDAAFWRLYAAAVESESQSAGLLACALWEEFRSHALAEGWFQDPSPEVAALYLHMAEILERQSPDYLEDARREFRAHFNAFDNLYEGQPPEILAARPNRWKADYYYLELDKIYDRACLADPQPDAFAKWLLWAQSHGSAKQGNRAADAWRQAMPRDSRPLLSLMKSAEERRALTKAVSYLDQAERLDALNPEVRRARLRLGVAAIIRYLKQVKPHLAARDISKLESLPQSQEGDRPAFWTALRWACAVCNRDEQAAAHFAQTEELMRSPIGAALLCTNLEALCTLNYGGRKSSVPLVSVTDAPSAASEAARACALGDEMNLTFSIPPLWVKELQKQLQGQRLNLRHLRSLTEAALRTECRELAYAASAAGLVAGGPSELRFLLLRARALPEWAYQRRRKCVAAVIELARRQRDMAVVDEAVDLSRTDGHFGAWDPLDEPSSAAASMTAAQSTAILELERSKSSFPLREAERRAKPWSRRSPYREEKDESWIDPGVIFEILEKLERQRQKRPSRGKGGRGASQNELDQGQGELF